MYESRQKHFWRNFVFDEKQDHIANAICKHKYVYSVLVSCSQDEIRVLKAGLPIRFSLSFKLKKKVNKLQIL